MIQGFLLTLILFLTFHEASAKELEEIFYSISMQSKDCDTFITLYEASAKKLPKKIALSKKKVFQSIGYGGNRPPHVHDSIAIFDSYTAPTGTHP